MIAVFAFLILTLLCAVALLRFVILGIGQLAAGQRRFDSKRFARLKRAGALFLCLAVLNAGLVLVTQQRAFTPPIVDENGRAPENSIAELIRLEVNGRAQWISLRGWDQSKPVLLFLAGGPGGTQMAAVRHELGKLEKHFVVVNWDQPGSGKSYYAENIRNITVDTYVEDGYALTEYLKERFSQEKIYLLGESWGSALGVFLAERYPESYHALIGTGQMVDFVQTERMDYAMALEIAKARGDELLIRRLTANGMPPYYGKEVTKKSAVYLNFLSAQMAQNPQIQNPGYNTLRDIGSPEYGLWDKINFVRGILNTYNHVYPQLYGIDLRTHYQKLEVPVFFFLGRHDLNAPTTLAEEYALVLDAPQKKLVWFEHSGHNPWINEREKFVEEVLACFSQIDAQK